MKKYNNIRYSTKNQKQSFKISILGFTEIPLNHFIPVKLILLFESKY